MIERARSLAPVELLRLGIVSLVGLGIIGTSVELLFIGHWGSAGQAIVWPTLAALAIGTLAVARFASPRAISVARVIAVVVVGVALVGIWMHVQENLTAGPLDRKYAATWDSLPALQQWWLAATGGVGPAPILAPGVLLQLGLGLLLATARHPVTAARPRGADDSMTAVAAEVRR